MKEKLSTQNINVRFKTNCKKVLFIIFVLYTFFGSYSFSAHAQVVAPRGLYFLGFVRPDDSPFGSYKRYHDFHKISGTYTVQAWLSNIPGAQFPCYPGRTDCISSRKLSPEPTIWLTLDGVRISGPMYASPYQVSLNTRLYDDGNHILGADVISNDGSDVQVVAVTVTIDNIPGGKIGPQKVAVCPNKYDFTKGISPGCDWTTYPGSPPALTGFPLPNPRVATPYTTVVSSKDLWVERMTTTGNFLYKFYETPGNHITILPRQRYAHADLNYALLPLVDGPRNVNQEGYLVGGYVDKTNGDLYAIATQGNFVQITTKGDIITHAGQRLVPGVNPYFWNSGFVNLFGSAGSAFLSSKTQIVGNFIDGPKNLKEPWDVVQDPRDPTGKTVYISDTLNHRLVKVDMKTTPATITTYAGSLTKVRGFKDGVGTEALFNEPWGLAIDSSGNLYVTDRLNNALRKIDTARRVTTILRSSKNPGTTGVTDSYRTVGTLGLSVAGRQASYMVNGNFSTASLIFPEGLEFDSEGKLVVAENFIMALRKIDLAAGTISYMSTVPSAADANAKNLDINIDTEGTCGPKDDILIGTFAQTGPWRLTSNGVNRGPLLVKVPDTDLLNLPTGRANTMINIDYPWFAICGNGAIWLNGAATQGVFRLTLAKLTDPVMSASDKGRYNAGRSLYRSGVGNFPPRPSFELIHGVDGINHNGNFPSFDELNSVSDEELKVQIKAGWGSSTGPRPEISGRDLDNLIFYIRWNCVSCIESGNIKAAALPSDTAIPVISGIAVDSITTKSVKIKWITNEPTVGFVKFWRNAPNGGYSNVADSYRTNHEVVLTDLTPGVAYFFTIRSKDEAGNQNVSLQRVFTTINDGSTDTVFPTVSITNPVNNSTVIGTVPISATATDDKGVVGVQFQIDGRNFGSEDRTEPFSISWDTTTVLAGIYKLTAIAKDAAGNTTVSSPVSVKVGLISSSTQIKAIANGQWSSVATWDKGRIPNARDDVNISGFIVIYDLGPSDATAEAKTITIVDSGVLSFSRIKSTQLDMDGSIMALDGGRFDVGTEANPIPASINVRIGFNVSNDRLFLGGSGVGPDPAMPDLIPADIGIWAMGVNARADFYGAQKPKIWTKLIKDSNAGSAEIFLRDAPTGWRVGDKILITSSGESPDQSEIRSISSVSGNKITLSSPLLFTHKGTLHAYNTVTKNRRTIFSPTELLVNEILVPEQAEVALLTQNVQVVSNLVKENDPNHRAHIAYMMGAKGSLGYAEFRDLGPRGKMGRYPIHFHIVGDASAGAVIRGVSVWSSISSPMNKCIVIHASNGANVEDSVGFNSQGNCYYLEVANELNNTLKNNLGVLTYFPEELPNTVVAGSFGYDPRSSAVFWAREGNTFRNNVAVSGKKDVAGFWLTPNLTKGPISTVFDGNESHSNYFGYNYSGDSGLTMAVTRGFLWRNTVGLNSNGSPVKTTTSDTLFYQNGTYFLPPFPGTVVASTVIGLDATLPALTLSFSVSPSIITAGQSSTLSWNSTNATSCTASGVWSGTKTTSGTQMVTPAATATYTLNCTGSGGSATQSVTVAVSASPLPSMDDIIIDNGTVGTSHTGSWCVSGVSGFYGKGSLYSCALGTLDTYRWTPGLPGTTYDAYEVSMWWTSHANRSTNVPVKILANIGGIQNSNTAYVNQQINGGKWNSLGTFLFGAGSYVEVSDKNGQANADAVKFVKVISQFPFPSAPTVSFSASPSSITSGQSSTLGWSSINATSCTASGVWSGTKTTSGTQLVSPTVTSTYTLICTGSGGSATQSVTVAVSASPPPPPFDEESPTVSIASPVSGRTVSGLVTINISASDNVGVSRVGLWRNNNHFVTDPTAPFSINWDTKTVADGTYTIHARAYDVAGNEGISPNISVTVNNTSPLSQQPSSNSVVVQSSGLPLTLNSPNVPESKIITVSTGSIDPKLYQNVVLELSAYDANISDEGELYINGNGPILLFGNSATGLNVYKVATVTISTPAGWWKLGDNTLRFTHTKTAGYRVEGIQFYFASASQATNAGSADSFWIRSMASVKLGIGEVSSLGRYVFASVITAYQNLIFELMGWITNNDG